MKSNDLISIRSASTKKYHSGGYKMESEPYYFKAVKVSGDNYYLSGFLEGLEEERLEDNDEVVVTKHYGIIVWNFQPVDDEGGFHIRDARTGLYLNDFLESGLFGVKPSVWVLEKKDSSNGREVEVLDAYVSNTFNVSSVPLDNDSSTVIDGRNYLHKFNSYIKTITEVSASDPSKWNLYSYEDKRTGLVSYLYSIFTQFSYGEGEDSTGAINIWASPELSDQSVGLLLSRGIDDVEGFIQLLVQYSVSSGGKDKVNYTTVFVDNKAERTLVEIISAFLGGYYETTVLNSNGEFKHGVSVRCADKINNSMEGSACALNLYALDDGVDTSNRVTYFASGLDDIKKNLVNSFISQIPESALDAMWFFGLNKSLSIAVTINNYSDKEVISKVSYFGNVDKSENEQDLSIPLTMNSCVQEGDNVNIPGIPVPMSSEKESPTYIKYNVCNNNHFMEGVGILVELLADGEESVYVSLDVPWATRSGINVGLGGGMSQKEIFNKLTNDRSLSASYEGVGVDISVAMDYEHGAPDGCYTAVVDIKNQ